MVATKKIELPHLIINFQINSNEIAYKYNFVQHGQHTEKNVRSVSFCELILNRAWLYLSWETYKSFYMTRFHSCFQKYFEKEIF